METATSTAILQAVSESGQAFVMLGVFIGTGVTIGLFAGGMVFGVVGEIIDVFMRHYKHRELDEIHERIDEIKEKVEKL